MAEAPRCSCGRPIRDNAHLCHRCTERLEQDLGDVRVLAEEIEASRYGQGRTGGANIGVTSRSAETALPFSDKPGERAAELRQVLLDAAQVVVNERGAPWPRDALTDLSRFLLVHLDWLRRREQAPQIQADVSHAVNRLRGTIEGRRPAKLSWGRCGSVFYLENGEPDPDCEPCPAEVEAWPNAKRTVCAACGTPHELNKERQDRLIEQTRGELMYVAQLSKTITLLGRPVADETIRSWVRRGRLFPHVEKDPNDPAGKALFLVGDVLDLLQAETERQATLAAKRRAC